MEQKLNALVSDGLWRKSLSAIRALGKDGFQVSVLGDTLFTPGFWSHFTQKRFKIPTAAHDSVVFGKEFLKILNSGILDPETVFFPMEDATLQWLSDHRDQVAPLARFLIPSAASLKIAQDKSLTLELANTVGIAAPKSLKPTNFQEFLAQLNSLPQPENFLVKPRTGSGSKGIVYGLLLSPEQWRLHWNQYGPLLIQERISPDGAGLGVSLLFDRQSRCIASFAHKRLKQYPVSGGPSTDRISIHDPELVAQSIRLLEALHWKGVAMVEWKLDPKEGKAKLMEINPRFWGSLELAVRSGVNFPLLYASCCLDRPVNQTLFEYPVNVRCRWFLGDILRFIQEPKAQRESFATFLKGIPTLLEEWDPADLLGTLGVFVCSLILVFHPRYWKYLKRG